MLERDFLTKFKFPILAVAFGVGISGWYVFNDHLRSPAPPEDCETADWLTVDQFVNKVRRIHPYADGMYHFSRSYSPNGWYYESGSVAPERGKWWTPDDVSLCHEFKDGANFRHQGCFRLAQDESGHLFSAPYDQEGNVIEPCTIKRLYRVGEQTPDERR
ncbi:MAG: hypothetical protein Alpg2KO_02200 [Alphaproteobacteria bacterium]